MGDLRSKIYDLERGAAQDQATLVRLSDVGAALIAMDQELLRLRAESDVLTRQLDGNRTRAMTISKAILLLRDSGCYRMSHV